MDFIEAREALHQGKRIRHESMPEGAWIEKKYRGYGGMYLLAFVDDDGCLSARPIDFAMLFDSALCDDDDDWEVEVHG